MPLMPLSDFNIAMGKFFTTINPGLLWITEKDRDWHYPLTVYLNFRKESQKKDDFRIENTKAKRQKYYVNKSCGCQPSGWSDWRSSWVPRTSWDQNQWATDQWSSQK